MKYRPELDGLRAIAVLSVAFYHAFPKTFIGGWAGVDVFFVLSGFLITSILSQEIEDTGRIRFSVFYAKRLLRLTPALWLMLTAVLIATPLVSHAFANVGEEVAWSATYLMNWNRALHFGHQALLGHTWSLAIEEQFYLFWPIILLSLYRLGSRRLAFGGAVGIWFLVCVWRLYLSAHTGDHERIYNGFDTHSDGLMIGCALGLAPDSFIKLNFWRSALIPVLLILAAAVLKLPLHTDNTQAFGVGVIGILSAVAMLGSMQSGVVNNVLATRPLRYTGRISYGFYLWHYPLLMLAWPHLSSAEKILPLLAAYAVAVVSYHWFEKPILGLRRRLVAPQKAQLDRTPSYDRA